MGLKKKTVINVDNILKRKPKKQEEERPKTSEKKVVSLEKKNKNIRQ